ncbi:DUF3883 domain-containing protein [Aromatoleum petrolei]|uniref:DUF3883 domain-containing protein n=1 Tax=Aromatoleum petrolei TaxID=76116 RepID=A0ABX1MJR9_9RHOO|nr:DUF3883 domain-containing protein [Aromatoleum petrolei]NMF86941.1 DUF3883 domain-containing protein [Aromatoleum petrolei]
MRTIEKSKRSLSDLGYPVASGVMKTIRLLDEQYGATDYHDSGHTSTAPTWIFKLPRYGNAEIGARMNKENTTLYIRDQTCDGKRLRDLIPADKVTKVYPRDGQPANSVLHSPYLGPSSMNEVLMLSLEPDDVEFVLAAFFGEGGRRESMQTAAGANSNRPQNETAGANKREISEEDFAALLSRQSETGRAGEMLVILDELERLRGCGCARPDDYVRRVAETDVARGYDVESTWPGEERSIEVKTSTLAGSDFFLTANERAVLGGLGPRAWLYRVTIDGKGDGNIVARLNDPVNHIKEEDLTPVVWRVSNRVFDNQD